MQFCNSAGGIFKVAIPDLVALVTHSNRKKKVKRTPGPDDRFETNEDSSPQLPFSRNCSNLN
jgi:hypothetical protein